MRDENKIKLLTIGESVWKLLVLLASIGLIISGIGVGGVAIVGASALAYLMLHGLMLVAAFIVLSIILLPGLSELLESDIFDWPRYRDGLLDRTKIMFVTMLLPWPVWLTLGLVLINGTIWLPLSTTALFAGFIILPAIGILCSEKLFKLGELTLHSTANPLTYLKNRLIARLSAPAPSVGNVPMITAHPAVDPLQMASAPEFNLKLPLPIASANSSSSSTAQLLQTYGLFAEEPRAVAQVEEPTPDHFLCPITHEKINDPVVAADGHTYEKAAIEQWFSQHNTSPMTGAILPHRMFIPNYNLRSQLRAAESALFATVGK